MLTMDYELELIGTKSRMILAELRSSRKLRDRVRLIEQNVQTI